ncbi:class I SAM-dependent methyltransferase [bacterium]|nr:MAG: class I SAM-dependent methyltransferase [bacterium]
MLWRCIKTEDILSNNRLVWDRIHLEGYHGYTTYPRLNELIINLPIGWLNKNQVLLEIGCGVGHFMEAFAPMVREVHGVDISEKALKLGAKRLSHLKNAYFHVTKGNELSAFQDATFDLVYSVACFQHIPKKITCDYLKEAFRVLKPLGLLVFQVITYHDPQINLLDITLIEKEKTIGYSREQIVQMVNENGLSLESINYQKLKCEAKKRAAWFWTVCKK